jgi:hypothetical protein
VKRQGEISAIQFRAGSITDYYGQWEMRTMRSREVKGHQARFEGI